MAAEFTTYEQVGIKEDISDVISNITPTKTPFLSSIKTDKVKNTLFQWQEDSLRAVTDNAQSEGFTAVASTLTATAMRSNHTQILSKTVQVSGTADSVSTYGRAKELSYQLAKAAAEVKRDLENALVGTGQAGAAGTNSPNGAGTVRKMAGAQAMLDTTTSIYYMDAASFTAPGSPSTAALTEDGLLALDQSLYNAGGEAAVCLVKPTDALKFAGFAFKAPASAGVTSGAPGRVRNVDDATRLVNAVEVYQSPFGTKRIVIDRFIRSTDMLVYDPDMWKLACLRPWTRETLAKTGDSTSVMIVGEFSLKHMNFKASGMVTDLS